MRLAKPLTAQVGLAAHILGCKVLKPGEIAIFVQGFSLSQPKEA